MDRFEKHIGNNKEFFDEPFDNKSLVWKKIENELENKTPPKGSKRFPFNLFLLMALMIVGLVCLSVFQKKKIQDHEFALEQRLELESINEHYGKLVSEQVEELKQYEGLGTIEKEEFLEYINELSLEQENLKKELYLNLDNEQVMDAIIENFNQQINLITQFLKKLDKEEDKYETGISM